MSEYFETLRISNLKVGDKIHNTLKNALYRDDLVWTVIKIHPTYIECQVKDGSRRCSIDEHNLIKRWIFEKDLEEYRRMVERNKEDSDIE